MEDEMLSAQEAADLLGVSSRQLNSLASAGQIKWYPAPGRGRVFKQEDVAILKSLREKNLDMPTVAGMALQALLTAKKLERSVQQLLIATGLNIPILELTEDAVVSLKLKMDKALLSALSTDDIYEWSRTYHALGEETLEALEHYTEDAEPWLLVTRLGKKLLKDSTQNAMDGRPETRSVHQLIHSGVRNARAACISYVQLKHGRKTALQLFPEVDGDGISELANLASTLFT